MLPFIDVQLKALTNLDSKRFETVRILKKLAQASRQLAELKGAAATIPNQSILINTLGMQEAKDSSEIENIVTSHDELYKDEAFSEEHINPSAKEVLRYRQALQVGYTLVKESGLLTNNHVLQIQAELERNRAGFRKLAGTALKNSAGQTVYTPPQDPETILRLMADLEQFMNAPELFDADPLIKMALIHHQFESIHPFYDGNGRTGRILNMLYLVKEDLLNIPVLYLSSYIVKNKAEYYRLLQAVRDEDAWEDWVFYMLHATEQTAMSARARVNAIKIALQETKERIRANYKFYSQDLINSLFNHPYTRIEFVQKDLGISRLSASKYLNQLAESGILEKAKLGRGNYYINTALHAVLVQGM